MKEDYYGPRGEISKPTPKDIEEIIAGSDQFKDIFEQEGRGYLSPAKRGGLPKKIERPIVSWMDKLNARDRARVEDILKEKLAEREEIKSRYGPRALLEFDKFLSALRVGHLDRAAGNFVDHDVVRRALLIGDFSYAEDLEELIDELMKKREITEGGRTYSSWQLAEMIDKGQIDDLPKFQNLRSAVSNLIEPHKDHSTGRRESLHESDNLGDEWKEGTFYDEEQREKEDDQIKRDLRGVTDRLRASVDDSSESSGPRFSSENPLDRFPDISLPDIEKLLRENIEATEFRGKIVNAESLDWPTLAQDGDWGLAYGEYTIGNEVYGLDFSQAEIVIPDLSFLIGEPFWRVAIYVTKSFSRDYYLPGLIYSRWLLGQLNRNLPPVNDRLEKIKIQIFGKSCQFFGSTMRIPQADCWSIPYLRFLAGGGFFWDKKLDSLWTEKDCAILIKKPQKT